jgi:hypothetical protein
MWHCVASQVLLTQSHISENTATRTSSSGVMRNCHRSSRQNQEGVPKRQPINIICQVTTHKLELIILHCVITPRILIHPSTIQCMHEHVCTNIWWHDLIITVSIHLHRDGSTCVNQTIICICTNIVDLKQNHTICRLIHTLWFRI